MPFKKQPQLLKIWEDTGQDLSFSVCHMRTPPSLPSIPGLTIRLPSLSPGELPQTSCVPALSPTFCGSLVPSGECPGFLG